MSTALRYVGQAMSYIKAQKDGEIVVKSEELSESTAKWAKGEEEDTAAFSSSAIQSRNDRSADVTEAINSAKASVQAAQQLIIDDEDREGMLNDFKSMELELAANKEATETAIETAKAQLAAERTAIEERVGTADEFEAAAAEGYSNAVLTAPAS